MRDSAFSHRTKNHTEQDISDTKEVLKNINKPFSAEWFEQHERQVFAPYKTHCTEIVGQINIGNRIDFKYTANSVVKIIEYKGREYIIEIKPL